VEGREAVSGLTLRLDQMKFVLCPVCGEPFSLTSVRYERGTPFFCPDGHELQPAEGWSNPAVRPA
jgi:hypothetical protein